MDEIGSIDDQEFPKVVQIIQVKESCYVIFQDEDGFLFKIDILKAKKNFPNKITKYLLDSIPENTTINNNTVFF
ncbi:hypothetical protein TVAG_192600 [Trichomonas vaginalis G3]|uniref:Uncharacterized protein n=1 Tax=Trichomonas vaginalis (strain ATCC PRA-98 / G3) TaxID=412133 RepID=A2DGX4_TRIV3|nr:hypothetical protein TVAGG3_0319040 [Trichomonas vaginalis G3]EAY20284.1 hypothetical protein TVAG_192600 [Trichomonas vaginalis G3]KAI5529156.1 hypothetical protein TVAGG3_0319040 [Trichomonas vaginalis G3]|eukprot:XP_001581270.1 hypothetical protein [Trichomonas vaginalis G3]